eukprot:4398619-Pleurochrysis_carterae.AAC.3
MPSSRAPLPGPSTAECPPTPPMPLASPRPPPLPPSAPLAPLRPSPRPPLAFLPATPCASFAAPFALLTAIAKPARRGPSRATICRRSRSRRRSTASIRFFCTSSSCAALSSSFGSTFGAATQAPPPSGAATCLRSVNVHKTVQLLPDPYPSDCALWECSRECARAPHCPRIYV